MVDKQELEIPQRLVLLRMNYFFQSNFRPTRFEFIFRKLDDREVGLYLTRSREDGV